MSARRAAPEAETGGRTREFPGACSAHYDRAASVLAEMGLRVKSADRDRGELVGMGFWGFVGVWFDAAAQGCRVRAAPSGGPLDTDYTVEFWQRYQPPT